jgi:hypothetical protein
MVRAGRGAPASKGGSMAWVVKAFKPEVLAQAEREARRVLREAGRETRDASAYLLVLEDVGAELREGVRAQRRRLGQAERPPAPAIEPVPLPIPSPRRRAPAAPAVARHGRARMRESPLADLFRATG